MSYDVESSADVISTLASQSLWNRAVSYDDFQRVDMEIVKSQSLWNRAVSYDLTETQIENQNLRLNPFGTGQCLTTAIDLRAKREEMSQSLWNRAVSYDAPL